MNPKLRRLLAELLHGLSAPGSIPGVLGAADKPWRELRAYFGLKDWEDTDEIESCILQRERLDDNNQAEDQRIKLEAVANEIRRLREYATDNSRLHLVDKIAIREYCDRALLQLEQAK